MTVAVVARERASPAIAVAAGRSTTGALAAARLWLNVACATIVVFAAACAHAQPLQTVPELKARVTDTTGTLSDDQRAQLEAKLAAIEQRKGSQVAVLIVPSTQPEAIEQYGIRVVEKWKLGRAQVDGKKVDDGVLLLVAKDDRKMRIEVGYGLEGAIPDAYAKRIIAETLAPRFRQGDFFGGIGAAVDDLGKLIEGESLPEAWRSDAGSGALDDNNFALAVMVVLFGGMIAVAVLGRVLGSAAGGAGGAVLATLMGLSLVFAAVVGVVVFVLFLFLSMSGRGGLTPHGRGRRGGVWTGGGGFGGGGGGFRGGGGGFGGGGASGGW